MLEIDQSGQEPSICISSSNAHLYCCKITVEASGVCNGAGMKEFGWNVCEFCSMLKFLTNQMGRWSLQGRLFPALLTESICWGSDCGCTLFSWHLGPTWVNKSYRKTSSMHHARRQNVTTCKVAKQSQLQAPHPNGDSQCYCREAKKKKTMKKERRRKWKRIRRKKQKKRRRRRKLKKKEEEERRRKLKKGEESWRRKEKKKEEEEDVAASSSRRRRRRRRSSSRSVFSSLHTHSSWSMTRSRALRFLRFCTHSSPGCSTCATCISWYSFNVRSFTLSSWKLTPGPTTSSGMPLSHSESFCTAGSCTFWKTEGVFHGMAGWLVGYLTSQQHATVSQGHFCTDKFTCCHIEIEVADQTFYLSRQTTRWGVTAGVKVALWGVKVALHNTRFVECRWWNDGWTVKTVITWWSSASMIPAPGVRQCSQLNNC